MSHFTVLVVGNDPEKQLEPFEESPDRGSSYLHFDDQTSKITEEYESGGTDMVHLPDGRKVFPWDKTFKVIDPKDILGGIAFSTSDTFKFPEGSVTKKTPFKDIYPTFKDFAEDWHGFSDPEDGKYGYWTNDNAKWDWYQIGGRWAGYFKLKPEAHGVRGTNGLMNSSSHNEEGYVDQAFKKDIDFEFMRREAVDDAFRRYTQVLSVVGNLDDFIPWPKVREEMFPGDIEKAREFYNGQRAVKAFRGSDIGFGLADLEDYQVSREEYLRRASEGAISTFAVLKDGKWYEKGEMGWWGMVSDEKDESSWSAEFAKLLDSLPEDTLLTVVDCHI